MNIDHPRPMQPRPDHAKKVFSGIIYDVYQWDQEMFDGTTATFETLKRASTVMIIPVTLDKKIIVTKQEQPGKEPFVGMVGGRVDDGEDVLVAAKREMLEESGMEAAEWSLFSSEQIASKIDWGIYTFVAHNCERVSDQNLDAGEKISLVELGWDDFIDLVCSEEFYDKETTARFLRAKLDINIMRDYREKILGGTPVREWHHG